MEADAIAVDSSGLKLTELLKEVNVDHSNQFSKLVDDTVSAIKTSIDKIPNDFKVTADLASRFVTDIGADKVEFKFKKPAFVKTGGSYSIQSLAKPEVNVDLIIRLPKECFHEKDYLNYRYYAKRCLYLCLMKKYLEKSPSIDRVEWSTLQNEARKPLLIVNPAAKLVEVPGSFVRIIPSAKAIFSIAMLNLKRCNIHNLSDGTALQATPKYNSSILEDMFIEDVEFINDYFLGWKELREALILLKPPQSCGVEVSTFQRKAISILQKSKGCNLKSHFQLSYVIHLEDSIWLFKCLGLVLLGFKTRLL